MKICSTYQLMVAVVSLGFLFGLVTSCDNTFEPLEENNSVYFSTFGFLDASADTQWIRVMPVKETIWLDPDQYEFEVTLENMGTGETVQMQDSLFSYGSGAAQAYNFWTKARLDPEGTYQLRATRDDGKTSSVKMTLPPEFPTPLYTSGTLLIEGVDNLADVKLLYLFQNEITGRIKSFPLPKLYDTRRLQNGTFQAYLGNRRQDIEYRESNFPTEGWVQVGIQIYVASAGPGWPEFVSSGDLSSTIFDYQSNVENGAGFVGGIVSKTLPFENCTNENSAPVPCPVVE